MQETLTKQIKGKEDSIKQAIQNPVSMMRSLVKNNLFYFIQYFWSDYSNDEFVPNWHIKILCDELEQIARRTAKGLPNSYDLIVNVPPGTTKTSVVCIFFPIWVWVNWYWMRFIVASHSIDLSLESAEYSRDLVRSERFKQLFPEIAIKEDKDVKSNFRVIKKVYHRKYRMPKQLSGGNRLSTSVKSTPTGFHGHILIWDDLIDPRKSFSTKEIKQANNFIDHTLSTRKANKAVTPTIGIMQRLHQNDPTAHLLKHRKNIKHVCLPGEIKTEEFKKLVKPQSLLKHYKDGLLDPLRLPWDVLLKMKDELGQYGYSGQIGQHPVPAGGGMFKIDHLQVVDSINKEHILKKVRYWDKAGTADGGAYTVGVKLYLLKGGKFVIADVKRGQWSSEVREKIIRETAEADGKDTIVYVEQEPGSGGKESAQSTITNLVGYACFADRPSGDKIYRADTFSVQVNNGNVMLLSAKWNGDFMDELEYFPNSTYKDQVDASSGAFNMVIKRKNSKVFR